MGIETQNEYGWKSLQQQSTNPLPSLSISGEVLTETSVNSERRSWRECKMTFSFYLYQSFSQHRLHMEGIGQLKDSCRLKPLLL